MKRIRKAGLAAGIGAILVTAAAFLALADTVYVNASSLNFRNRPSMDADAVLGTLPRGTKLERLSDEGEWSQVKLADSLPDGQRARRTDAGPGQAGQQPDRRLLGGGPGRGLSLRFVFRH